MNQNKFQSGHTVVSDQASVSSEDDITFDAAQHRAFVQAIFNQGLQSCSPSLILDEMRYKSEDLTSERVKSHLQKFRNKGDSALVEFMASYDSTMKKYDDLYRRLPTSTPGSISQSDLEAFTKMFVTQGRSDGNLVAGEVAANLSVADMLLPHQEDMTMFMGSHDEANSKHQLKFDLSESLPDPMLFMFQFLQAQSMTSIKLPVLTEEEKQSPLGAALCYIMGLFMSMRQHIAESREKMISSAKYQPTKPKKQKENQPTRGMTRSFLPVNEDDYEPPTKRRVAQVSDHSSDGEMYQLMIHHSGESEQLRGPTMFTNDPTCSDTDLIYKVPLNLHECSSFPINISDLDLSSHMLIDQSLSYRHSMDTNECPGTSHNSLDPLPLSY